MIYNTIVLHVLLAVLKGIVYLVNESKLKESIKQEYFDYCDSIDKLVKNYLTKGDDNGK